MSVRIANPNLFFSQSLDFKSDTAMKIVLSARVAAGIYISSQSSEVNSKERKFAVAILAEKTIPIAVSLLKSKDCEKKRLGFAILTDMWPVVSQVHLLDLKAG